MFERINFPMSRVFAAVIPFLLAAFGVLLANFPVSFLGGILPSPLLALMPVYFWCLVRPDLMPPGAAFAIGILEDVFSGGPPGIWALSFVASYALVDRQRDAFAGLSGIGAILGFAAAMLTASGTAYVVMSIYHNHMMPLAPIVLQVAVSVLFYIPVVPVLVLVHRRLVGPLRSDF
ncbi:MAG: rod shape-determining protein MreD [Alphaproteobacteria bacterium]|nr:rod shape-determining protein MreD [Alphaproteobacteria bacterium]